MNPGQDGNIRVGDYEVRLDLGELLCTLLETNSKHPEKDCLWRLLDRLSIHQVELVRVLSRAFPELAKKFPKLFQKRIEDYRRAFRVQKLFSFRSMRSIEEEAARMAWNDTQKMLREVSMLQDPGIRGLLDDHRAVLRRICEALVTLVKEQSPEIHLDLVALKKFLEGY
jgi:hypothetical protein